MKRLWQLLPRMKHLPQLLLLLLPQPHPRLRLQQLLLPKLPLLQQPLQTLLHEKMQL
jgi:hypothetical protein